MEHEHQQFQFMPPGMRIPQDQQDLSEQSVEQGQFPSELPQLSQTPLPQQPANDLNSQQIYLTPIVTLLAIPRPISGVQVQQPFPEPMPGDLPVTPRPVPLSAAQIQYMQMLQQANRTADRSDRPGRQATGSFPARPACSIPGYRPYQANNKEPGINEILLSCAILLITITVILALFYYLSLS